MSTTKQEKGQQEQQDDLYQQETEELTHISERIGQHLRRAEVRQRAIRFLEGLLSSVERQERLATGRRTG